MVRRWIKEGEQSGKLEGEKADVGHMVNEEPENLMDTPPDESDAVRLARLADLLAEPLPQSLLRTHPNDVVLNDPPEDWQEWWQAPPEWISAITDPKTLPGSLARLLHAIRALRLTRDPTPIHNPLAPPTTKGMSPKKQHEVERMISYIRDLFVANGLEPSAVRIVDVGAGQGHLTRALKGHFPDTQILALDADEGQTIGAQRWQDKKTDGIAHRTVIINPTSLLDVVNEWIQPEPESDVVVPVLFVALHACGSLTPDILRAFLLASRQPPATWKPFGVVAVGCCYNLMNPKDFPLSQPIADLDLPIAAYHLAAQIPDHWLVPSSPTPTPLASVTLAIRKVAWRALLAKAIPHAQLSTTPVPTPASNPNKSATVPARWSRLPTLEPAEVTRTGETPKLRRLSRLRDSAYDNWETFLRVSSDRLGLDLHATAIDPVVGRRVELLHVLRCLLGPAVESTILLDRLCWMQTALQQDKNSPHVRLVNLFNQATGSGRNVAIVIAPEIAS